MSTDLAVGTRALRTLSARPQLVVDDHARRITDSTAVTVRVGIPGPFGRERVVAALPTNKTSGPVLLEPARVVCDSALCYLGDADGNMLGEPAVWVHRMAYARWVGDTRRL